MLPQLGKLLNPRLSTWGWPSGLENTIPEFWEFTLDKCVFKLLRDFAVKEYFSYESLNTRKEEKLITDKLPRRGVQDSPLSFFCPTSHSSQESKGFFYQQATHKGKYGKPRKPLGPPGLVYRHKKGTWESQEKKLVYCHKKGTWEGQEKEKKRKEKDQGRREAGSSKGKVPCALHQEFLLLVHKYLGLEAARSGWYETWSTRKPCAKEVPETDYFTQQKQYLKRTT